jgi:hypothetical protein
MYQINSITFTCNLKFFFLSKEEKRTLCSTSDEDSRQIINEINPFKSAKGKALEKIRMPTFETQSEVCLRKSSTTSTFAPCSIAKTRQRIAVFAS